MPRWLARLARPSLDWLLIFLPIALILEAVHAAPTWVFVCACLAIIPVAGWMGHATEHLAGRLGEGIGGLLNATFGNAAELIIAGMALWRASRSPESVAAMHGLVKASLTGSIIGNLLLVLGVSLLAGGLRYNIQTFNATAMRTGGTLLTLAVIALLIPDLFAYILPQPRPPLQSLSLELSGLLLVVYALSLVFTLKTHKHLYVGEDVDEELAEAEHSHASAWSVRRSLTVLLVATIGVAVLAELLIGSVEEASTALGLNKLFVGVIIVAIVGNAAEHSTAVLVAMRNRMDLALGIGIGSSIQIALFVTPVLVLLSYAFGAPMDLVFTPAEIVSVGIAVIIMTQIAEDGESNWLEGVFLLVVYLMIGALFYHLDGERAPAAG
jgi:Ca2+:H+ antiporter